MTPAGDERRFNEKLDDLQAAHPFSYNLAVGVAMGLVALVFDLHWVFVPLYALAYAALRAFLWGDQRILRRQYDARKIRSNEAREQRRRQRG